jgi:hypothetical protein
LILTIISTTILHKPLKDLVDLVVSHQRQGEQSNITKKAKEPFPNISPNARKHPLLNLV